MSRQTNPKAIANLNMDPSTPAPRTPSPVATMKAWTVRRYGGPEVLRLEDLPRPVAGEKEILVRILATTVTAGDWRVRTLDLPRGFGLFGRLALGFRGPRQPILGTELAGIVEAIGKDVTRFRVGDSVFAFPGTKMGSHAQYRVLHEDAGVAQKPAGLSYEEAASLSFGGSTALHFLRRAQLRRGDRVLVLGSAGAVGTALVQLAKQQGAHVTAVTSRGNLELVASLGADRVVDRTAEDPLAPGAIYDVVADAVGASSFAASRHALTPEGRFLAISGGIPDAMAAMRTALRSQKVIAGPAAERPQDVQELAGLAAKGALRPVIDRTYSFGQMAEAHAYVATRRKRGSVVVTVPHGS